MLPFVKVPVIVHTNTFGIEETEDFEKFLAILCSIEVKELVIDHSSYFYSSNNRQRAFCIEEFKMLTRMVYISEIHVTCIDLNEENVREFISILATIKGCRVKLYNLHPTYSFTVKDFELMAQFDIKVVLIDTSCLSADTNSELLDCVKVIRKMKYLE